MSPRSWFDRPMLPGADSRATRSAMLPSPRADLVRHYLLDDGQPAPAEAATDLGIDDDAGPPLSATGGRLYGAVVLVSACAIAVMVLA